MKPKIVGIFVVILLAIGNLYALDSNSGNWQAKWISTMECQSATNTWLAYRKTINIITKPEKAIVRIAVDSKYWLWINGKQVVFEGGLKRGPNPTDSYYDEVDIASFLKTGKNTIAVMVWYFGKDGFSHKSSGRAGIIFDCQTTNFKLLSDKSWKCAVLKSYQTAGEPLPNFRLSESSLLYDSRKSIGFWQAEEYNDNWMPQAVELGNAGDSPWNKLVTRPIPLFKDFGLKSYLGQEFKLGLGEVDTIVCKLPYNAQITPYFKIESAEGKKITICTDNYLFYNGSSDLVRGEYITSKGIQEYENLGWMNGHKVYYILPKGTKVLDLKYRESGYDTEFAGSFQCSDPFFNLLWQKAARTLYITMRDNYMDCPDRERAQWTGDAVNESGESFYALSISSHALTKKWLYEFINWQRNDGVLYSPVPSGNWMYELPCQSLATVGYYGLWNYYLNTADKKTIADLYTGVQRYLNLWEPDGKGTMKFRGGDWAWGDWGENRDMLLINNLWYYLAVKGVYNMALELGKSEDAKNYALFMENFKSSFNKQFWTGCCYRDPDYKGKTDDRTQALAVVSGIADKDKYSTILKVFQAEKHASPYMEKYVFEAMMQMGYEKEALARHKERFDQVVNNHDFTTLFEGWGIGNLGYGGGTVNHAWSGGGLTILSQYVCGLSPVEPGWKTFKVKPQLGSLTYAETSNETVAGKISVKVEKTKSGMTINLRVPYNTHSIVCIPLEYKLTKMNGKFIYNEKYIPSKVVEFNGNENGYNTFKVGAGEYVFRSKLS
ncbi:MAG: alpha-L-rhamnosidase C-terminal domain-containing protein [Paludibacter sp.]|nr:alpha-L-rhamnosidase C-terminal domain-containing protein [Paludibacter sp.]